MQLVRIAGPTEPMRRLGEVAGLDFERTSARRLDDDRWQVSGYASDEALATLRERGLEVESVVEPAELERGARRRCSPSSTPTAPARRRRAAAVAYPSTVRAIEAELARLAADHPDLCTRTVAPNRSHEGRSVSYVTISGGAAGGGRRCSSPAACTRASGRRRTRC